MPLVAPEDAEYAASGFRKLKIRKMPFVAPEDAEYAASGVRRFGKCR